VLGVALGTQEPRICLIFRTLLHIYDPRVWAIDLRLRRSGFAVFEGPRKLLDFETTSIPSGPSNTLGTGFQTFATVAASVIVVKRERWETMMVHSRAEP
jgi:hypothetical protein